MQPDLQSWFGSNYEAAMKPVYLQNKARIQVYNQVVDQVHEQVHEQVYDHVVDHVWDQVMPQVGDQVHAQLCGHKPWNLLGWWNLLRWWIKSRLNS